MPPLKFLELRFHDEDYDNVSLGPPFGAHSCTEKNISKKKIPTSFLISDLWFTKQASSIGHLDRRMVQAHSYNYLYRIIIQVVISNYRIIIQVVISNVIIRRGFAFDFVVHRQLSIHFQPNSIFILPSTLSRPSSNYRC